jgi:putative endonuclease
VSAHVVRLHHPQHQFSGTGIRGATSDLKQRLPDHNAGKSTHTAKFKPWKLVWYCAFPDKYKALEFEKYLKSHSGRAFAKKRLQ